MTNTTAVTAVATSYLERAKAALSRLGLNLETQPAPLVALLDRLQGYNPTAVMTIAATMQQSSAFNAMVRKEVGGMDVSTRYVDIVNAFNSIIGDSKMMADAMDDGKLDMGERGKIMWMKLRRGSIPDRFDAIHSGYMAVSKSVSDQIERESAILGAYRDFRMALKQAEVSAQEVLQEAGVQLEEKKQALSVAGTALEAFSASANVDPVGLSKLELLRDEAIRNLQDEDSRYQLAKNIADDAKTGYNTAELVFARLQQIHGVKERLHERSITFFSTNEVVFTGLAASFQAAGGLHEATGAMEAMKDGVSNSLEALASSGGKQLEQGLRAAHGSTIRVESVRKLADAVVEFQASTIKLVEELRVESTQASAEIEAAVEDSKRRFTTLLTSNPVASTAPAKQISA